MEFKRKVRQSIKFIQRFNFLNFYMGGFTINMSTYFLWLILPLLMKDNGGTSFQIGLADAITFGVTGITCPFIGLFLTKKWFPAGDVTRIGFILQGSCCVSIAIYFIDNGQLLPLFFLLLQESYALSFFWSICEFLISEEVYKGETNKKISYFSCSWSLGKAIGFLLGGVMRSAFGYTYSLYFAAVISLVSWVTFPRFLRNRSDTTHAEAKELKTINVRLDVHTVNDVPEADTRKPYYYMMYYVNLLIIHCTVYGTVAIFGNQYIDYADEEEIVLDGINDDPGVFVGAFLGIIYFSQTLCFYMLGLFSMWQYKPILNIIVQLCIIGMSVGMIYLRNGWILCLFAIPIGFISGYDIQSAVLYSVCAEKKIKGIVLGITEMVGELSCCLCPLFAGLLSTLMDDKVWALYFGIILQIIGIVLCSITHIIILVLEFRRKVFLKNTSTNTKSPEVVGDELTLEESVIMETNTKLDNSQIKQKTPSSNDITSSIDSSESSDEI